MKNIWIKCLIAGTFFGAILSSVNYALNSYCINSGSFCTFLEISKRITYFPTIYLFLSNAISFVNENKLISIMFFLIPILQYSLIGSVIGLLFRKKKAIKYIDEEDDEHIGEIEKWEND